MLPRTSPGCWEIGDYDDLDDEEDDGDDDDGDGDGDDGDC